MRSRKIYRFLALVAFCASASHLAVAAEALQFKRGGDSPPTAPKLDYDTRDEALCSGDARAPETEIEQALVSRGWLLTGDALQQGGSTALIASATPGCLRRLLRAIDRPCRSRH